MANLRAIDCCPPDPVLESVDTPVCPVDLRQILRLFFQKRYSVGTTPNAFNNTAPLTSLLELTTWQTRFNAVDGTKIVKSPYAQNGRVGLGSVTIPEVAPITIGGGTNDTANGEEIIIQRNPVKFLGRLYSVDSNTISQLNLISCNDLVVFMANNENKIWAQDIDGDDTNIQGFVVSNLFIGDRVPGGLTERDYHSISFNLEPGWDTYLKGYQTTFALTM